MAARRAKSLALAAAEIGLLPELALGPQAGSYWHALAGTASCRPPRCLRAGWAAACARQPPSCLGWRSHCGHLHPAVERVQVRCVPQPALCACPPARPPVPAARPPAPGLLLPPCAPCISAVACCVLIRRACAEAGGCAAYGGARNRQSLNRAARGMIGACHRARCLPHLQTGW